MIPSQVKIVEVGPRDGLQNEEAVVPSETKFELIERLADAGAADGRQRSGDGGHHQARCCGLPGFDAQFAGLRCSAASRRLRGRRLRRGFGGAKSLEKSEPGAFCFFGSELGLALGIVSFLFAIYTWLKPV